MQSKKGLSVHGLLNFSLSLLILLLIAVGTICKSRRMIVMAFFVMVALSLLGWYQYIFPTGLSAVFFAGTLAIVLVVSVFFYAIYSYESILLEMQDGRESRRY